MRPREIHFFSRPREYTFPKGQAFGSIQDFSPLPAVPLLHVVPPDTEPDAANGECSLVWHVFYQRLPPHARAPHQYGSARAYFL